jgi:hypothetical protein
MELKLNGTYQLLVYIGNVDLLAYNIITINKNKETVIVEDRKVGLERNVEKTKYFFAASSPGCSSKL